MSIYPSLFNREVFNLDETGKSKAFFVLKNQPITKRIIGELYDFAYLHGCIDVRICLHSDVESKLHNMILLQFKSRSKIPHKHINKDETYHIVTGQVCLIEYNDTGEVVNEIMLDEHDNFIYRVEKNIFHTVNVISEYAVIHESREGPFDANDSIFMIRN